MGRSFSMSPDSLVGDRSLAEIRLALAPAVADAAGFDGWGAAAVAAAAAHAGVAPAVAELAYGVGDSGAAMAMIAAWTGYVDVAMAAHFGDDSLGKAPVRERIRRLVSFRLDTIAGQEEALRRAMAVMAMPQNVMRALRLGWASADAMWRLAGDEASDFNHYSKRAILSSLYAATLAVFVNDDSPGKADTAAFLARRIDGVMRFEKAKARWLGGEREYFSPTRFLGRLRYPMA